MGREGRHLELQELMERRGYGAILLSRPANFAWYTGGADNRVDHADPLGVASVLVTREAEYVLTDNIEAGRMREEEVPDLEVVEYPWYEDSSSTIDKLAVGTLLGADWPSLGTKDISEDIASLRHVLDPDAIERYRRVGADAAAAMTEAADALESETDEQEAAAILVAACRRRMLFTPVALAAGRKRVSRYRHPIPNDGRLGDQAMLTVCAERGGLYANLTRMVYFEEPNEESRRRQKVCETILQTMREATTPGRLLSEVFEDCKKFYVEAGFPEEWKLHHQGGLTGYASRQLIATPETSLNIEIGMAFAWNPSVTGAKAEETFILTNSGAEVVA